MYGGLYDRIYEGKNRFELGIEEKKQMLLISEDIAYMMYSTNTLVLGLLEVEEQISKKYPNRIMDYAIGNYYEISEDELSFTHKTLQEFFVCSYLVHKLEDIFQSHNNGGSDTECVRALILLFYNKNFIYSRLEEELSYHVNNSNLRYPEVIELFKLSLPYIFDYFFNSCYLSVHDRYASDYKCFQNCFSSICTLANVIIGENWCQNLSNSKSFLTFLKTKQYVPLKLSGLSFEDVDLSAIYFRSSINKSSFSKCNMCRCDFRKTTVRSSKFSEIMFCTTYASKMINISSGFSNVDYSFSDLNGSFFHKCTITDSAFLHTNLMRVKFTSSTISDSIFVSSDFGHSEYNNLTIEKTKFDNCSFSNIDLRDVIFESVVFTNCRFFKIKGKPSSYSTVLQIKECHFNSLFIDLKIFSSPQDIRSFFDKISNGDI